MTDWPAEWFDEIDSTNEEARRRVSAGQFSNGWIAARVQTAGRGRLGRDWISPRGNLYATALFHFDGSIADATKLPFAAALAVSDVFEAFAPDRPVKLKWPNDVRFEGAKVCGILIEAGQSEEGCWIAAGIGINVAEAPAGTGQAATCLAELRGDNAVTADMVLEALRTSFSVRLVQLSSGFEGTRQDWLERAEGLMAGATVKTGTSQINGTFEGMGPDGEMLLRLPNGALQPITAGDVELIKERVS